MACVNARTVCGSRLSAKSAISSAKVILVAKMHLLHIFDQFSGSVASEHHRR
jgi:hypothetical protein